MRQFFLHNFNGFILLESIFLNYEFGNGILIWKVVTLKVEILRSIEGGIVIFTTNQDEVMIKIERKYAIVLEYRFFLVFKMMQQLLLKYCRINLIINIIFFFLD